MKGARIATSLLCGLLSLAAVCVAQDAAAKGGMAASLDAAITSSGALQGTLVISAFGAPSLPFRESFVQNATRRLSPSLLGRFTRDREAHATPLVIDAGNQERAIKIQFQIREDDFILPIQRQAPLQLDLVTLISPITTQPDGNLHLGSPGTFREQISVEIPTDFTVEADAHLNNENSFARYQSDSKAIAGKLVIVRELQLKQETVAASQRADVDSFRKMIADDQRRAFVLRRIKHADLTEWIQSVPADKTKSYGLRAYQQREYEAARQLFERATRANPNDPDAWNSLGLAFAALARLEDAQMAYEKQIAINPKGAYGYNNLGVLQERGGFWEMAIESFKKQIEIRPGDPNAIANLPGVLMQAARWAEAEDAAAKALQLRPKDTQQQLNLAIARVCQGKVTTERQEIDTALGAAPSGAMLNTAAYFLTECDRENLADPYIRRALELLDSAAVGHENMSAAITLQNSRGTYLDTYGWLLFKKDENERAIKLLNAAASLTPRGEIYVHLARAQAKAGNNEKAALYWREATFLQPGQLSHVPPEVATELERISPLSIDRVWYPLGADLSGDIAAILPAGQPSYFFLTVNADGSAQSVRELDSEDPAAKRASPLLRAVKLPVIQGEGGPLSSAYVVKLVRGSDGKVVAGRSITGEAVAIASELMPGEFPLPDPAASNSPSTESSGDAYRIGGGVSPPSILYKVEPEYSEEARRARLEGAAQLFIIVDTNGKPRDIRVLRSLGLGLDEKAMDAVSKWQFQPGAKSGQAVPVQAQIQVNFRLLANNGQKGPGWHLGRAEFRLPDGALRAVLEKVAFPHVADDANSATATVTFDVNEKGEPVNAKIEKSSDDEWGRAVTNALGKWRFTPASKDGVPVTVSCTMDFVRGN